MATSELVLVSLPVSKLMERRKLAKETRNLQINFDQLLERIMSTSTVTELKSILSRLPNARLLKNVRSITDLQIFINRHISWFNYDLLHFINDQDEADNDCKRRLTEYGSKLKQYLQERVRQVTSADAEIALLPITVMKTNNMWCNNNNAKVEVIALNVDRAWDTHVLEGDNCNKTSRKIASILGRSGSISGHYHEPWLFIMISQ